MLFPKEHGAYGQLLIPLLSALAVGAPAPGAYLLAAAGVAAFLAHEGALVQLGQRGGRATRELGVEARRSVALFGGFCVVTGLVALTQLPTDALVWLVVPLLLGACVGVAVWRHLERTTGGEILVAIALSSLAVPVALGGDVTAVAAHTLFSVFVVVFVTATLAVRALIGRVTKAGGPPLILAGIVAGGAPLLLALLAMRGQLASIAPYAASPMCAVALVLTIARPSPKHLRTIGWTLVGATVLTAVVLIVGLR
ncbi:MAG: YwiC-like family protein [Vicinamibacterales bacterium]